MMLPTPSIIHSMRWPRRGVFLLVVNRGDDDVLGPHGIGAIGERPHFEANGVRIEILVRRVPEVREIARILIVAETAGETAEARCQEQAQTLARLLHPLEISGRVGLRHGNIRGCGNGVYAIRSRIQAELSAHSRDKLEL